MTKEQIQKEIAEMNEWIPVSKIEERLGMPPTTLQKVLKGTRELPKKWHKKLEAYFIINATAVPENTNHQNLTEEKETISEKIDEPQKETMAEKLERLRRERLNQNKK